MKKLSIVMLSLMTIPSYAQSMLSSLSTYQETLKTDEAQAGTPGSAVEVKPSSESISSSSTMCEENDQTSLPLAYVTSLIQKKNASLEIQSDPRVGRLSVSSEDMIGNCSSMLEWKLKKPEINGRKSYAIEVNIKQGQNCNDSGCSYKVAKAENGEFKEYTTMSFKPTLKGFEECLQKSGVIVDGKVVPGAIYPSPVKEKFSGLDQSAPIVFLSHGPSTPLIKAKYGKFQYISGCDYYETIHPEIEEFLTYDDAERIRLDKEANKLKDCKVDEYGKLSDFIERYENYSSELGQIRDRLIIEAAKKSAEAFNQGKYSEDDIKVMYDFEKYIVNPKIELAKALYEEMIDLEGDAMKAKQEELKIVLAQISALNQKPFFLPSHTQKLISDGRFEEAERLNSFRIVVDNYQRLGAKQDNVVITPELAEQRVASAKAIFARGLVVERERYEIRTGQVTGKSQDYAALASRMRRNIQVRTENYMAEIQLEAERIQQPNGYCFKYWRNAQKCIQETQERIQQLQAIALHYNKVDAERAAEYDAEAKSYGELEAQGRRYVAAQSGEEEAPAPAEAPVDTTVPTPRTAETPPGVYNFNYQGGQQQQPFYQQGQMMPQQQQFPVNPYQNQNIFQSQQNPWMQQQNPWLGQQGYGMQMGSQQQGNYGFNWNAGVQGQFGYQQQPQNPWMQRQQGMNYWNQPNQAYNQYSMYGGY